MSTYPAITTNVDSFFCLNIFAYDSTLLRMIHCCNNNIWTKTNIIAYSNSPRTIYYIIPPKP